MVLVQFLEGLFWYFRSGSRCFVVASLPVFSLFVLCSCAEILALRSWFKASPWRPVLAGSSPVQLRGCVFQDNLERGTGGGFRKACAVVVRSLYIREK